MIEEKLMTELILEESDILKMLDDLLERRDNKWWDTFYKNRENKRVPFFIDAPDENLVDLISNGKVTPGKVLDVGCGNGRNSVYLAQNGFKVDAIDFSSTSIEWAQELAERKNVDVNFINGSFFDIDFQLNSYDFIYDAGCLHHIKPHRRNLYLQKISSLLRPNGTYGLTCFNLKGGANITDFDVYRHYSMKGGIGFSQEKLLAVLTPYFKIDELREMREITDGSLFGKDFLWAVQMRKA